MEHFGKISISLCITVVCEWLSDESELHLKWLNLLEHSDGKPENTYVELYKKSGMKKKEFGYNILKRKWDHVFNMVIADLETNVLERKVGANEYTDSLKREIRIKERKHYARKLKRQLRKQKRKYNK